ncbi:MAG TPA: MoxR family ATPase [Gemmatimonadetes bacterium]|nr:MoxR family ATPase [Gemmatimonadota bacterium]
MNTTDPGELPGSVDSVLELLQAQSYVADRALATAIHLSLTLGRPLLLEGEAGVGKTEVGKVLARGLGRRLIRLQCYEGLDVASAVYEWDYARQMIAIRLAEASGQTDRAEIERDLFSETFLIRRPLLEAIQPADGIAPVLLIDELDRADEPFEAFLLELLSDFQITVPELGTLRAEEPPVVVITSNRTREIHDALRRRCFYSWIDYPGAQRELEIVRLRVPEASESLLNQVVAFVQRLRTVELFKLPGVAESIDWTRALLALGKDELDAQTVDETLGVLLKYQDDVSRVRGGKTEATLAEVGRELAAAPSSGLGAAPEAAPGT